VTTIIALIAAAGLTTLVVKCIYEIAEENFEEED
jgi:hypothetical protein